MGKMVVLGASDNPDRYACKATKALIRNGYEAVPVGFKPGFIKELEIITGTPQIEDVDTLLIYMGARKQQEFYNYIIGLKPKRVIFNPGTENEDFRKELNKKGIKAINDCALIMLNTDSF